VTTQVPSGTDTTTTTFAPGVTTTTAGTSSGTSTATTTGTTTTATDSTTDTSTGSDSETSGATSSEGTEDTEGTATTESEVVVEYPAIRRDKTRGLRTEAAATLVYRGLGDYSVLAVPKSDASLLMGLVRNYLLLNGIPVTTPQDPTATAVVYVTVDVFGINRSRFDAYLYNRENVKAETAIEMFAFDRDGQMIMRPQSANYEADYDEKYLFWAGPFRSDQTVQEGEGLLVDFSDVDGTRATYPSDMVRTREFGIGGRPTP